MKDYDKLIEDTKYLLTTKGKELESAQKRHDQLSSSQKKRHEVLEALRDELDQKDEEFRRGINQVNNAKASIRLAMEEQKALEADLAALKREAKITELQQKQRSFWDALKDRLAYQIDSLDDGLEGISNSKDPGEVCEAMRKIADGMNFSIEANAIRNVQSVYQQTILKLCEMKVDGKQILPEHKQERLRLLDRFLLQQKIAPMWSN